MNTIIDNKIVDMSLYLLRNLSIQDLENMKVSLTKLIDSYKGRSEVLSKDIKKNLRRQMIILNNLTLALEDSASKSSDHLDIYRNVVNNIVTNSYTNARKVEEILDLSNGDVGIDQTFYDHKLEEVRYDDDSIFELLSAKDIVNNAGDVILENINNINADKESYISSLENYAKQVKLNLISSKTKAKEILTSIKKTEINLAAAKLALDVWNDLCDKQETKRKLFVQNINNYRVKVIDKYIFEKGGDKRIEQFN